MRPRALVVVIAGTLACTGPACNQVFGVDTTALVDAAPDADLRPDRDKDGIADVEDPCIAVERDATDDSDLDGTSNATDSCPFLTAGTDTDGDGVGDACDPFSSKAGDRVACTMRFFDTELNASLWKPRTGEAEWAVASGYLVGFESFAPTVTSVIAQDRISPTGGTTMLEMGITTLSTGPVTYGVWVSAGPTPSSSDVACEVRRDTSGVTVSVVGATPGPAVSGPPTTYAGALFRAIFQPGKAGVNLACTLSYGGSVAVASGHFDGPLGQQGFSVREAVITLRGMVIYHRDDQPDFE
jgi:hypothetical protein